MREDYHQSLPLNDGVVFQKIRQYEKARDWTQARKWRSRLSQSKQQDLRQLCRSKKLRRLRKALDALLQYPGLWDPLEIGTFHRILPMKCPAVSITP
jgi:hypothetical protein